MKAAQLVEHADRDSWPRRWAGISTGCSTPYCEALAGTVRRDGSRIILAVGLVGALTTV
jgi:hypothetical protein